MFTRRHYRVLAGVIRWTARNPNLSDEERRGILRLLTNLTNRLARDNPSFNAKRFMQEALDLPPSAPMPYLDTSTKDAAPYHATREEQEEHSQ